MSKLHYLIIEYYTVVHPSAESATAAILTIHMVANSCVPHIVVTQVANCYSLIQPDCMLGQENTVVWLSESKSLCIVS